LKPREIRVSEIRKSLKTQKRGHQSHLIVFEKGSVGLKKFDLNRGFQTEQFECANCSHVGPTNIHGACEHCGSPAVISLEVAMALTALANTPEGARHH
jgi:Zn finger protein HypA/HybF involved in hydrogenase expression